MLFYSFATCTLDFGYRFRYESTEMIKLKKNIKNKYFYRLKIDVFLRTIRVTNLVSRKINSYSSKLEHNILNSFDYYRLLEDRWRKEDDRLFYSKYSILEKANRSRFTISKRKVDLERSIGIFRSITFRKGDVGIHRGTLVCVQVNCGARLLKNSRESFTFKSYFALSLLVP